MVQPFDYMHSPGASGLTVEVYASRTENGTGNPSANPNTLYAQPFFTGDVDLALASLGVRVTVTGTAQMHLAVYAAKSERDIYPGDLLHDLGVVTYGSLGQRLAALAATLPAGRLFWLASNTDGGTGTHVRAFAGSTLNFPAGVLGWLPTPGVSANVLGIARVFGLGMPATFPAGAVPLRGNVAAQDAVPAIILVPSTVSPIVVGGLATGGTVVDVVDGGHTWRVHTFTANDTFTVTQDITSAQFLLLGGGGGGGSSQSTTSWASGGGGGGGRKIVRDSGGVPVVVGAYPVVVGTGGAGGLPNTNAGTAGTASSWNGVSAAGGDPGGAYATHSGGASDFAGGAGGPPAAYGGGGGGGSGAVGTAGTGAAGGTGGAGVLSSITGVPVNYGGGGGGGIYSGVLNGAGGAGGGGAGGVGGVANANGSPGTNGLGGGGGGASTTSGTKAGATSTGGRGGDGVVIIRYPIA